MVNLPMEDQGAYRRKDLARGRSLLTLWGIPVAVLVVTLRLNAAGVISQTLAAALFSASVLWIAVGCLVNARRCGRVHCIIVGTLFPILSIFGIADTFGIISLNWNYFWAAFFAILITGFSTEYLWRPYSRPFGPERA
jgi:hypothetical protein